MVYDLAGRQLWKHEESGTSGLFENYTVSWDLTSGGVRMRPGVYIYRAAISTDNSKDATKARKFIILGDKESDNNPVQYPVHADRQSCV